MVKTEEKNRKASQLGATTWKVKLKRVLNAFAKWRTRLLTNFIGFSHFVWTITKCKQKI